MRVSIVPESHCSAIIQTGVTGEGLFPHASHTDVSREGCVEASFSITSCDPSDPSGHTSWPVAQPLLSASENGQIVSSSPRSACCSETAHHLDYCMSLQGCPTTYLWHLSHPAWLWRQPSKGRQGVAQSHLIKRCENHCWGFRALHTHLGHEVKASRHHAMMGPCC